MVGRVLNNWIDFVRDHLYVVIVLISASLIGLVLVQVYLLSLEIDLQRRQFDKEIGDRVLLDMHHIIEDDAVLSNQLIQVFSRSVGPAESDSLQESLTRQVRELTDSVLLAHNIGYLEYDFAFYQRIEDTIVFSSSTVASQPDFQPHSIRAGWRVKEASGGELYRFGLLFHNRYLFLFYRILSVLVITAVFVAILLGSFFSTLLVLKRQKQLSQLKNDFINNLTHELKTPIFASSIIFKIIKEKRRDLTYRDLDHHISLLEKENRQLKHKVEKVLELTVLERKNAGLDFRETDVHEVIRQKKAVYQILISEKNGSLTYDLQAERPTLLGDPMHLGNILDNLLDNAIKYSELAPDIRISTSNQKDALVLEIRDRGMGIDGEDLPFVFDKFYRVTKGNLHQTNGFGLGLSYVKTITELHRGRISLASKPGEGCTFSLTFPVYHRTKPPQHATKDPVG